MAYRIIPTNPTFANRKAARALEKTLAMPFEPLDSDRLRALLTVILLLVQAEEDQRMLVVYGSTMPLATELEIAARLYAWPDE
jgi:hypothetical protein